MPRSKPSVRPTKLTKATAATTAASQRLTAQAKAYMAPRQANTARLNAQAAPYKSTAAAAQRLTRQAEAAKPRPAMTAPKGIARKPKP